MSVVKLKSNVFVLNVRLCFLLIGTAFVTCFSLVCSALDESLEVVCLSEGYFIELDKLPFFHVISREDDYQPGASETFLAGKILKIFVHSNVISGELNIKDIKDEFYISENTKGGFFIVDLNEEVVISGLNQEEAIRILKNKYLKTNQEVDYEIFDLNNQKITSGTHGHFICR